MATLNISLSDPLDRFVNDRVVSGEFQNPSEVVSAGLLLLKAREYREHAKRERLEKLVQDGLDDLAAGRCKDVDDITSWLEGLGRARQP
jgi:putative addiction module CopG family antidote